MATVFHPPLNPEVIRFGVIQLLDASRPSRGRAPLYRARIDEHQYTCCAGAWTFWVPDLRCKFLHSRGGLVHCIHARAPGRDLLLSGHLADDGLDSTGRYTWLEWRQAYGKRATRRLAELYIAAARLHASGLGPAPLGICLADCFVDRDTVDDAGAVGLVSEDATRLPARPPATRDEILAAGVFPDKIESCLRQPTNGYVTDLSSVVGVVPIDAGPEIDALEAYVLERRARRRV